MKKVSLLLCLLFIFGCTSLHSNSKDYTWEKLTNVEAYNFFYYTNHVEPMYGNIITSSPYAVPEVRWIKEVYAPFLKEFLRKNEVSHGVNPDNNCVKFSVYGVAAGFILHFKEGEGPTGTSLAIGIVDYVSSLFINHSINCFLARDQYNHIVVVYFEPQTQQIIDSSLVESNWIFLRM